MGNLTDFFVAGEGEIDQELAIDGPRSRFETVEGKGVDDIKVTTLNGIVTERDYEVDSGGFDALHEEVPMIRFADEEEGPWIFRLPPALVDALAGADESKLGAINEAWARTEEWELDGVRDPSETRWLVDDLARLSREARRAGKDVLLWLSL